MKPFSIRVLDAAAPGFDAELERLIAFEVAQDDDVEAAVAAIVRDVRARGDAALIDHTRRFDRLARPYHTGDFADRNCGCRTVRLREFVCGRRCFAIPRVIEMTGNYLPGGRNKSRPYIGKSYRLEYR